MACKAKLVSEIKALQRADPDAKHAWWHYCDSHLIGLVVITIGFEARNFGAS